MYFKVDSYAALRKLPLGTEVTLIHNLRGPQSEKRKLVAVKTKTVVFEVLEGPNKGMESEMPLVVVGSLVESTPKGFRITFNGGGYMEYEFT